jgi:hypothetical protein
MLYHKNINESGIVGIFLFNPYRVLFWWFLFFLYMFNPFGVEENYVNSDSPSSSFNINVLIFSIDV